MVCQFVKCSISMGNSSILFHILLVWELLYFDNMKIEQKTLTHCRQYLSEITWGRSVYRNVIIKSSNCKCWRQCARVLFYIVDPRLLLFFCQIKIEIVFFPNMDDAHGPLWLLTFKFFTVKLASYLEKRKKAWYANQNQGLV